MRFIDRLLNRTRRTGEQGHSAAPSFEALEPRLLLAADLTGVFGTVTLGATPTVGTDFTATLNITNNGPSSVDEEITVQFWMTTDGVLDSVGDYYLSHEDVDIDLGAGGTTSVSDDLHLPSWMIPGPYRLMAFIDSKYEVLESNEGNNFPFTPTPGAPYWVQPQVVDLTGAFTSSTLGATPIAGTDFTASLNVTNAGTDRVDEEITVQFWMTTDGVLDGAGDYYLGHEDVDVDLAAGGTKSVTEDLHLPSWMIPGPYRLMAFIDSKNEVLESNEANNFPFTPTPGAPYQVQPQVVDLTGAWGTVGLGATPAAGDDFTATLNITNIGTDNVKEGITVQFWMTTDGVLDGAGDYYLSHEDVDLDLGAGGTKSVTDDLHLPSWMIPGPYRLMAVIDSKGEVLESNEGNNFPFTPTPGAPYWVG